jgi:hypothetical protein
MIAFHGLIKFSDDVQGREPEERLESLMFDGGIDYFSNQQIFANT